MPNLYDYRCPPDCPKRSKTCHAECERHEKYRELNEQRKRAEKNEQLTVTEALRLKLNKNVKKRKN